jgi:hypothetical protein
MGLMVRNVNPREHIQRDQRQEQKPGTHQIGRNDSLESNKRLRLNSRVEVITMADTKDQISTENKSSERFKADVSPLSSDTEVVSVKEHGHAISGWQGSKE